MPDNFEDDDDVTLLARLIFGEARGESVRTKLAVALSVVNRTGKNKWWGNTLREVILKPWQYSAFNPGDPNRKKLLSLNIYDHWRIWQDCRETAQLVLAEDVRDFTHGATHYHDVSIDRPAWASGHEPCFEAGRLKFYAGID